MTPAEIEARIAMRQQNLAATLQEIGVRVHPKTIVGDARARAASAVDRATADAFVAANRVVSSARAQLVSSEGAPRMDRVIPAAAVVVAVAGLLVLASRRRR